MLDEETPQEDRLWAIEHEERRRGVPLLPVAIVAIILALLTVFALDECFTFRMKYAFYGPSSSPMSPFRMTCDADNGTCSCTQAAGEVLGGVACELDEYDGYEPTCR